MEPTFSKGILATFGGMVTACALGVVFAVSSARKVAPAAPANNLPRSAVPMAIQQAVVVTSAKALISSAPARPTVSSQGASAAAAEEDPTDLPRELESRFQHDPAGTTEARAAESLLRDAYTGASAQGTKLEALECRAETCRVQVVFPSRSVDDSMAARLFLEPATMINLKMNVRIPTRVTRDDGSVAATIYLLKPGPSKPVVNQTSEE